MSVIVMTPMTGSFCVRDISVVRVNQSYGILLEPAEINRSRTVIPHQGCQLVLQRNNCYLRSAGPDGRQPDSDGILRSSELCAHRWQTADGVIYVEAST
jgi:hypothetical protein